MPEAEVSYATTTALTAGRGRRREPTSAASVAGDPAYLTLTRDRHVSAKLWRPLGDSNPCFRREVATSQALRRSSTTSAEPGLGGGAGLPVERGRDQPRDPVRRRDQRRVRPPDVVPGRHPAPRVAQQLADGRVRVDLLRRRAGERRRRSCDRTPARPAASNRPASAFFRSARPAPSRLGNTQVPESRGSVRSSSRAARPTGRVERPVLVDSSRRQRPGSSTSVQRSEHTSSRRDSASG